MSMSLCVEGSGDDIRLWADITPGQYDEIYPFNGYLKTDYQIQDGMRYATYVTGRTPYLSWDGYDVGVHIHIRDWYGNKYDYHCMLYGASARESMDLMSKYTRSNYDDVIKRYDLEDAFSRSLAYDEDISESDMNLKVLYS